ncbi:Alpha actinin sarcomeric [Fasciolopsis buskii]|uniref:Alpha actinin sarcomeric n=1 Tax=Fasciolopsis buskii TaxID=27845 RepID=A0A8E0S4V0_9TREM|nr:Alpha actinin sarcomeric [Fasciolopsis buski]
MPIEDYEGYPDTDEAASDLNVPIDPAWELQQKKTFTAWCNAHLRKVNEQIVSIENDFRNGLKLMRLLEVISGEHLPRPDRGKMRFHQIANVNKALDFIESKGVKLVSIGAEEIVDGNVKMTLGMIWTIILRFAIQDIQIEDSSAKEGLLLWCQRQTAPYKNVKVENFHTSFKDGLPFCAIIHRNRPELIKYSELNPNNALYNLNYAFDVAEKHLDIPRMLDPEDMVKSAKCDERSVMAYVSMYYHKFAGASNANIAANRISNFVRAHRENKRLITEYETLASDLLSWIVKKLQYFSLREPKQTTAAIEQLQSDSRVYRRQEKPERLLDKAKLETTYNTIQTRLRLSNRVPYIPAAEIYISSIGNKWDELEKADKLYEEWLLEEMQSLRRVEYLVRKFEIRCSTHEAWAKGKPSMLSSKDYLSCNLPELRALMKRHEAFQSELAANDDRVERIRALADELAKLKYHNMQIVNSRYSTIFSTTQEMKRLSENREHELARLLPVLEKIDQLHLDFAKLAAPFKNWMEHTEEDLHDSPIIHSMAEVQRYLSAHKAFESTLEGTEKEDQAIKFCARDVDCLVRGNKLSSFGNLHTSIQPDELPKRWAVIKELVKRRSEALHTEEQRQLANDKLRHEFAQKATELDRLIQQQKTEITKNAMEARGTLEEQREQLKGLESKLTKHKQLLDDLEHCNQALEDAYVFDNPFTTLSMPTLRVAWAQLFTSLHHSVNKIENQILTRDSKGLTAEQMEDLRTCFNHFDRDHTGRLEPNEFKACLVSLGHKFSDEKRGSVTSANAVVGESDFSRIMQEVDPGRKNWVIFESFLDFMTRENADEDTAEQIIQSFKALAGDKGCVTAADLRKYLSAEDAEYCIKHMSRMNGPGGDNGALNYQQFSIEIYGSRRQ